MCHSCAHVAVIAYSVQKADRGMGVWVQAPTTEEDQQVKAAIARADERVQQAYQSSIASHAAPASTAR